MERSGALNQGSDSLGCQLYDLRVNLARVPGVRMNDRRNDALAKLCCPRQVWTRRVVLHGVRKLQNLPDKRSVCESLRSPVLGSEPGSENVVGRFVVFTEYHARSHPAHARHGVDHEINIFELLIVRILAAVGLLVCSYIRGIKHSMDAVQVGSQIELARVAIEYSLIVVMKQTHVWMRHVVFV